MCVLVVGPESYGHFFGGDCYVVLYTYLKVTPTMMVMMMMKKKGQAPYYDTRLTRPLPPVPVWVACDAAQNGKPQYVVYFWQGLSSSTDEKGASALHAVEVDKSLGGAAVQVGGGGHRQQTALEAGRQ